MGKSIMLGETKLGSTSDPHSVFYVVLPSEVLAE